MNRAKLLSKLAKLKALSECPTGNPNETAAAAERMTRLMLEAGIASFEIDPTPKVKLEGIPCVSEEWRFILCGGLAKANSCECLSDGGQMFLVGDPDDIAAVREMWTFACVEVERHAREWVDGGKTESPVLRISDLMDALRYSGRPMNRAARVAQFCLGAATMIAQRAMDERNRVIAEQENSRALVWLNSKEDANVEFLNNIGVNAIPVENVEVEDERAFKDGLRVGNGIRVERDRRMIE